MENAGYIGLSRQIGLERAMDAIAQNVANMNTTGYKGERVRFREYIETLDPNAKIGRKVDFVIDQGMLRNLQPGSIQKTDNPLNLALGGTDDQGRANSFFAIQAPNGERYTRNGNFKTDVNGQLQTQEGFPVLGANGQQILIPRTARDFTIAGDGTISANIQGQAQAQTVGQLRVVTFAQPQNLERQGDSLYMAYPANAPQIVAQPKVIQGALETSNVQAMTEMTRMIAVQRSYESAKNLIDTANSMSQDAVKRLGQKAA